jgi:hypothetical protein
MCFPFNEASICENKKNKNSSSLRLVDVTLCSDS